MPTDNRTVKIIRAYKDWPVVLDLPAKKIGNNFFQLNFFLNLSITPSHFYLSKYNSIYIYVKQLKKLLILQVNTGDFLEKLSYCAMVQLAVSFAVERFQDLEQGP